MNASSPTDIIALERAALERWGRGDPGGFLDLYAPEITYFDPLTAARIDGHAAMTAYYAPFVGKIQVDRFEMLNPHVVLEEQVAVLSYNLVNYSRTPAGDEVVGSRWNSTVVFQKLAGRWRTVHSHWSFTRHPALAAMSPEATERQA